MVTKNALNASIMELNTILDRESSDEAHIKFMAIAKDLSDVMDETIKLLTLAKKVRELQKSYFAARKKHLYGQADELLDKARDAEKELDRMIKTMESAMSDAPVQATLFE